MLGAIGRFEARPLLAVGVSGGPDSMALIILANRWARAQGGEAWALHVDHRLRPESGDEGRVVAGWLAARGIPHRTLIWDGPKPATGIQEAARAARYDLLAGWCREQGCLHLLTAHHRDDQIETHLIRRRAGSGADGLAGMSAIRYLDGCRLLRPLLSVPRASLAALIVVEGQDCLHDPSNDNPAYERARTRKSLKTEDGTALSAEIRTLGLQRMERELELDMLLARSVALHPAGFAAVDAGIALGEGDEMAERLLARVVACVGGAQYQPRHERIARLRASLGETPDRARTLGGCRIVPWRGRVLVMREPQAPGAEPIEIGPATSLLWDRRFWVDVAADSGQFTLRYLGTEHVPQCSDTAADIPGLARASLPAFWDFRGLAAVPHLGYRRADIERVPRIAFRPANRLTRSGFTVV